MKLIAAIFLTVLLGCASQEELFAPDSLPQLIEQIPLPPIVLRSAGGPLRLEMKILVERDGTVRKAELLTQTGDPAWDVLALQTVSRWKFRPAMFKGEPIRIWIRVPVVVLLLEQQVLELAEIVLTSRELADSLYEVLRIGKNFEELAKKWSQSGSAAKGGYLGQVDIRRYPDEVQRTLGALRGNEITRPLRVDNRFVILKRLPPVL